MSIVNKILEDTRSNRLSQKILQNGLPFDISLEGVSDVQKKERAENVELMEQFNKEANAWAKRVEGMLRSNIRSMVKNDTSLSSSIKKNVRYDRKYGREVKSVGFFFDKEGIYIHKGAGRGQGGYVGSQWTDKYGIRRKTNPESMGKMGTGNRQQVDWFNPTIEIESENLANTVAEYSADLQVNALDILIKG